MDSVHLVHVHETATQELHASGARLTVRISGQSLFTGTQAFKKAAEVASCIAALKACGISEEQIHLLCVSTRVESGILMKSSSAIYDLQIDCPSLELLGSVLAAISSQKNSEITEISWDYPELEKTRRALTQTAVRAAKDVAQAIAESLGVALLGVHQITYEGSGADLAKWDSGPSEYLGRHGKARVANSLESLSLAHRTRLKITVKGEFIVGTFGTDK